MNIVKRIVVSTLCLILFVSGLSTDTVFAATYYKGNLYYLYVNGEYYQSGVSGDRDRAFRTLISNKMVKGKSYSTFFSYGGQTWPGTKKKSYLNAINEAYKNTNSKDVGVFYYSGHGGNSGVQLSPISSLSWKDLAKALANTPVGKMIVIIDACHAGSFYTKGVSQLATWQKNKLIVFVSCSSKESCKTGQYSVMLKTALGSAENYGNSYVFADLNCDQKITAHELGTYVGILGIRNFGIHPLYYSENSNQVVYSYNDVRLFVREKSVSINKNKNYQLHYAFQGTSKVKFSSKNEKIVTVNSNGLIKGKKRGTTDIIIQAGNKIKSVKITVK